MFKQIWESQVDILRVLLVNVEVICADRYSQVVTVQCDCGTVEFQHKVLNWENLSSLLVILLCDRLQTCPKL